MVLRAFLPQVLVVFPYFPACIFRSQAFLQDWEMLSSISSIGKARHDAWAKNHRIVFWGWISNCSLVPARLILQGREVAKPLFVRFWGKLCLSWSKCWHKPLLVWCSSHLPSPFEPPVGLLPAGEVLQCSNASPVSPELLLLCSRWALSRCQVGQLDTSPCQVNPKVERWSCFSASSCCQRSKNQARMKSRAWPTI